MNSIWKITWKEKKQCGMREINEQRWSHAINVPHFRRSIHINPISQILVKDLPIKNHTFLSSSTFYPFCGFPTFNILNITQTQIIITIKLWSQYQTSTKFEKEEQEVLYFLNRWNPLIKLINSHCLVIMKNKQNIGQMGLVCEH